MTFFKFSQTQDPNSWNTKEVEVAHLIAIPRRWWSISQWRLVNGFIRRGLYFLR